MKAPNLTPPVFVATPMPGRFRECQATGGLAVRPMVAAIKLNRNRIPAGSWLEYLCRFGIRIVLLYPPACRKWRLKGEGAW